MRIPIGFVCLLFLFALSQCKAYSGQGDTLSAEGILYEGIPVSLDGCGHMIMIDSVLYKAIGIPDSMIEDGKVVSVTYVSEGFFYCGRGKQKIEQIRIVAIKPE